MFNYKILYNSGIEFDNSIIQNTTFNFKYLVVIKDYNDNDIYIIQLDNYQEFFKLKKKFISESKQKILCLFERS